MSTLKPVTCYSSFHLWFSDTCRKWLRALSGLPQKYAAPARCLTLPSSSTTSYLSVEFNASFHIVISNALILATIKLIGETSTKRKRLFCSACLITFQSHFSLSRTEGTTLTPHSKCFLNSAVVMMHSLSTYKNISLQLFYIFD